MLLKNPQGDSIRTAINRVVIITLKSTTSTFGAANDVVTVAIFSVCVVCVVLT